MSILYSALYLTTNVIAPIFRMIYAQLRAFPFKQQQKNNQPEGISQKQHQATGNLPTSPKNNLSNSQNCSYRCSYGKWALLVLSILLFSILNALFPKSLLVILLGLIVKVSIIYAPKSIVQSFEVFIQKLHLQEHLQTINSKAIEISLDLSQKIHFFIVFYSHKQREEQLIILNRMKDSVSRIQLELEENSQIKNRSFIVAVKKMQSIPKHIKSYENAAVTCDLLKPSSDVGKELLKLLEEKTFKERSQNHLSKIQQPTKDRFVYETKPAHKSAIYPTRSQSLQEKVQKMKNSMSVPTSEKKRVNQVKIKDTPFMIKRSQTDIGQQLEQESPKRTRQNHHITWNNNRTQKLITCPQINISGFSPQLSNHAIKEERDSSMITNAQNVAVMDISASEYSQSRRNSMMRDVASLGRILEADESGRNDEVFVRSVISNEEPMSPHAIPQGVSISSIDQHAIHPFKLDISGLSNPLVLSNTISNTKILPNSVVTSTEHVIISESKQQSSQNKQQSSSSKFDQPIPQRQLSNVSQANTIINAGSRFSEQSSIPNNLEVSINESDYSDMFDNEEEEEAKLEIKVQVIIQNPRDNGLKPRMEICYIELYSNDDVRFLSMHDKLMSSGKLLEMIKKPDNYYELVIQESNDKIEGSNIKEQVKGPKQIERRVKFRGQAKPFMKYLQKA